MGHRGGKLPPRCPHSLATQTATTTTLSSPHQRPRQVPATTTTATLSTTTTIRVLRTKARTSSTRVRSLPALAAPRGCFRLPAACRRTAELALLQVEPVPPEAFRPS
uniref:(northern house mosquito) hypothetical protein n=1 Tax=Culex pipiens TaxID=7175 RepID=A0A8D8HKE5_CULPI